jgi:hypothetical protein
MRSWLWLAPLVLGACVDTNKCGLPQQWQPCAGESPEPGASGSPPGIQSLAMPTCAYVDNPIITGTLQVSDADGDAEVVHMTTSQGGMRLAEADTFLDSVGTRTGNDWTGPLVLTISGTTPASFDIRVKVDDVAGNQSLPVCNTVSLVQ